MFFGFLDVYPFQDRDRFCPTGYAIIPLVVDITSFLIIIGCKVTQFICCNLIILFVFLAAAGRNK
ncbi:MAG: hypothetical protein EB101_13055 [Chitinophagia bacterium]|nr:hypothetical protein [Chitinophagia bacterium]